MNERELALIAHYANCQLGLSPRRFYAKWAVSYETIASICARSPSTVRRWFSNGKHYRAPSQADLRHLALMDLLLEQAEQMPPELWQQLCLGQPQPQPRPDPPST